MTGKRNKNIGIFLVLFFVVLMLFALIIGNNAEIHADSELVNNDLQMKLYSSTNAELVEENIFRIDAENKIKEFIFRVDNINFSHYNNNDALKNIIALYDAISKDTKAINEWSDDVLLSRVNVIIENFPLLEIRQDKIQLKRTLDDMLSKDIPSDRRYKNKEIDKYNDLIDRANSMISNMDISEENVLKLDKEITKFTNKYEDYPWWAWLIFCLLTIFPQICLLVVVLCVPLWYCTFLAWWHTLLILIPVTIIVDTLIILILDDIFDFC